MQDCIRDARAGDFAWFSRSFLRLKLSWRANLVYMALASFANSETQTCFPSKETLGLAVGVKKSTIYEGLKELKDAGVIEINIRENDQNQTSNEYVLLPIPFRNTETPVRNTNPPPFAERTPPVRNTNPNKSNLNQPKINNSAPRTPRKAVAVATTILPPWLDRETWEEFRQMRKRVRAPMTPHAEKLLIDRLTPFASRSKELLERSIVNCWKDIYPESNNGNQQRIPAAVKLIETEFKL